jgi:hypothetical protein
VSKIGEAILARPALAIAILVSASMAIGLLALFTIEGSFATDFSVYWRAANEPVSMAYLPLDALPFAYPPTMLLWIKPLALLPMWAAWALWVSASASALWVICRRHLSPWASALVLCSPPLVNGLSTGQVSAALAAILLWACGTSNRIAAGAAFAVIASVKPQLVIMAPLLLLFARDWKALGSAAATLCLILAASLLAFGLDTWFVWAASLNNFRDVLHQANVLGVAITPAAAAENYGLPALPFLLLGASVGAWLVYLCRRESPLALAAAVAGGSLLAAPYALTYDLAAVVPFLVRAVFQGRISAALALSGALNPLPLIAAAFELTRSNPTHRSPLRSMEPVQSPLST